MKRQLMLFGLMLLLIFVLSGCTETISEDTKFFMNNLTDIEENLEISLTNINTHLNNYDTGYKWSVLMNYLTITNSMLDDMENYQDLIEDEISYIDDLIIEYNDAKNDANIKKLDKQDETTEKIKIYIDNK